MDHARILELDADALEAEIRRHDDLYWVQDAPEIPDALYDAMVERLRALRPDSEVLDRVGPGDDVLEGTAPSKKVVHDHPMLSLDKCYTEDELLAWFDRFDGRALATHKIDGVAMSLRYGTDGQLELGATRGNGRIGEDITENCRRVGGIPESVDHRGGLEVRGEAYMPLSVFRARFAEEFANPRNLTAGALKLIDPERTRGYGLRFFAYDALGLDDVRSEEEKRARLTELGFEPAPGLHCERDNAFATFEKLAASRLTNDFETDGIVYRVDDVERYRGMGMTAHHPRGAIAFKYQGESGTSRLVDVLWSVSRSGTINPVAQVEPVSLSGVTVTRISLHNLAIIERLADRELAIGNNAPYPLSAGATVLITRRGGVIPHVETVVEPADGALRVPVTCPSCGAPTERHADFLSADHDRNCTSQGIRTLEHFAKVVDLRGFGPKVLEQLWDRDMARTPADLYALTAEQLEELDRMGEKSAQNLLEQLDAHREIPLSTFLAALGIPDLGGQIARSLEAEYATPVRLEVDAPETEPEAEPDTAQGDLFGAAPAPQRERPQHEAAKQETPYDALAAIRAARPEELTEIDGIGPVVAEKIFDGLAERAELIDALLVHVRVTVPEPVEAPSAGENAVAGKSFVFTGALDTMSRDVAQERVRALGGATPSGVSRALDYLVIGDADFEKFQSGWASSKLKKARAITEAGDSPLRVISESEFLSMLDA